MTNNSFSDAIALNKAEKKKVSGILPTVKNSIADPVSMYTSFHFQHMKDKAHNLQGK